MTLTFADLHGVEKGAPLPRKLSVDGMPEGDDPQVGDLGYWAPDGNLVLYYGKVGYWTGIMRVGRIDGDMQAVAALSGDFDATVDLVQ
ncbi:cyclophilin-like fold protein [Mycobacterium sp. ITM-2016-00316]|uniref:cyclophilin-like fold protein n=1 Tax=Mycobacterium sp. ITM-2016-00316 TaxID=2099695 RepID=UPI0037C74F39